LNYKNENHLIREEVGLIADVYTHVYTFILHPDQTFEILLDGESKRKGSIIDEWDLLPPKKIKDPHKEKPADWVDEAEMDDPTDAKPTGWDDIPDTIPDPDAEMPDDWDEELDGQWEAPHIDNPAYKGAWKPKRIPNPAYQGAWVHPMIDNPEYKDDKEIYHYVSDYIGIEIWQVKAGSLFDDFIVTDSVAEAEKLRAKGIASRDAEKKKKEAEEAAARAEADKAKTAEDDDDEDEEEEEEADDHAHDEL
jgi:calreticulin